MCWLFIFKVTEPSSTPYRTPSACAKRAAYPDPPPVIPVPDTGVAQVTTSPGRGLLAEQDRDVKVSDHHKIKCDNINLAQFGLAAR